MMTEEEKVRMVIRAIKWGALVLLGIIVIFSVFGTVNAGERGIKTRLGAVVGVVDQGAYFKMPFIEKVHIMDVKTRTITYDKQITENEDGDQVETDTSLSGASKDLQDVKVGVVVTYHVDPTAVGDIFAQYRSVDTYEQSVLEPIVREAVKATSAAYTAEELVTKRLEFSDKVNVAIQERFAARHAQLEKFSVTNFEFSASFSEAIESKVTAVQNAEAAKNKLEQTKYEAQQRIEQARGEAEAIRIQTQAVNAGGGANYVKLEWIKKWKGEVPHVSTGGDTSLLLQI